MVTIDKHTKVNSKLSQNNIKIILTMNEYKILAYLYQNDYYTELQSITIKELQEKTNLSISKIREAIKKFKTLNYINEGFKHHKAKSYYITQKGIEKVLKSISNN